MFNVQWLIERLISYLGIFSVILSSDFFAGEHKVRHHLDARVDR